MTVSAPSFKPGVMVTGTTAGTIVHNGPFEFRIAGLRPTEPGQLLRSLSGQAIPASYVSHLAELGIVVETAATATLPGRYIGYRLLDTYRISVHETMKANPLLNGLRTGIQPAQERAVVVQETHLRESCARAMALDWSSEPTSYRAVADKIALATTRHAAALIEAVRPLEPSASTPLEFAHYLRDSARQGPATYAAALFTLQAGENVRGAATSPEPCLYDLFRHTPVSAIDCLKDQAFSPFTEDDPSGPVEMLGALGELPSASLAHFEQTVLHGVSLVDKFYRECLGA